MLILLLLSSTKETSPGHRPEQCIWRSWNAETLRPPLSAVLTWPKGKQSSTFGTCLTAVVPRRWHGMQVYHLRGSIWDLCWVYFCAFSPPKDVYKAVDPFFHGWAQLLDAGASWHFGICPKHLWVLNQSFPSPRLAANQG